MKRLTKTELELIAERIANKVQKSHKEAQELQDTISDRNNKQRAEDVLSSLAKLSEDTKNILNEFIFKGSLQKITLDDILKSMRVPQTKYKRKISYRFVKDIYEELVLAQIESEDLNSLINKVTRQFLT